MTTTTRENWLRPRLGATILDKGFAEFRLWAPDHNRVEVIIDGTSHPLNEENHERGIFSTKISVARNQRYWFRVDGTEKLPDPCSRFQPEGIDGPSQLVNIAPRMQTNWTPPSLEDLVIYELHIGAYSPQGTFSSAIPHFPDLRQLGVRAIEIMPVATFPGTRGWGYDGVYPYAPHPSYGTPQDLRNLIDSAHASGLAVIMDVVYNHVGPGSHRLTTFAPYFTTRHTTFWGPALDYSQWGVREWAIQNAEMWVTEYGVDGLRIDAAHSFFDESGTHILTELAERAHSANPHALVISEMEVGDRRPLEVWGHDAQWADDLHHAVHVLITGEHEGYYSDYGTVADVAKAYESPERERLVVCAQNHDQVGNRAFGDRLHGSKLRLAAFCSILSPGTPLLFMGEEYDEPHPFQFFTDHTDPEIANATRTGRRREFSKFTEHASLEVPDPQAASTFHASKLDPRNAEPTTLEYYRELLRIRGCLKGLPAITTVDEKNRILRVKRGKFLLVMNFSKEPFNGIASFTGLIQRC